MSPRRAIHATAFLVLIACGERPVVGTPPATPDDLLKASDIVIAAQCEFNRAVETSGDLSPAVLTITMTVIVTEATGGGLTLTIPIAGSRIQLDRARRPIGSAVRQMEVQMIHDPRAALECPSEETPVTSDGVRFIEGGLGLSEWVAESDVIAARTGTMPEVLNYSLGFDISLTTSFNPVFSRTSDVGVSPDLSPENADARRVRHRIAVTLLPDIPGRRVTDDGRRAAAQAYLARL